MENNTLFDFTVDKANRTVNVKRTFAASLDLVWEAWTSPEILDQWWAPRPWTSKTKFMDFSVGGKRHFAMISPEGEERWSIQEYTSISPKTNFRFVSAFADSDGNAEPASSDWDLNFSEHGGTTTVDVTISNQSFDRMERLLEGFREGFTKALENLDGFLSSKKIPATRTVSITLPVKDLQRSVAFYTALGFEDYPHASADTVKYMFWSQHISLTLMTREKFASLVPKPLADTKQTMGSFFTLSVTSLDELNGFMDRGLKAGGTEPNEADDYGFMHQRTIEDYDGHCWNVMFIDASKLSADQQNEQ
jgi:predicted lactoylglutathione lyase/uncharacterized protein YndB with AHSA1/START domain